MAEKEVFVQDTPDLTWPPCGEQTELMGARFSCERPLGHDGDHGNGPFIEYTLTWPHALSLEEGWSR